MGLGQAFFPKGAGTDKFTFQFQHQCPNRTPMLILTNHPKSGKIIMTLSISDEERYLYDGYRFFF